MEELKEKLVQKAKAFWESTKEVFSGVVTFLRNVWNYILDNFLIIGGITFTFMAYDHEEDSFLCGLWILFLIALIIYDALGFNES